MRCGLLKLSRVLRERARGKGRTGTQPPRSAQVRCERGVHPRSAGEQASNGSKAESEFAGWPVSVDNFS